MLTDRNQLPPLQALERPDFEAYFQQFKTSLLANLRAIDSAAADELEQSLAIEGELITKMSEQFIVFLIARIEAENERTRQMLPGTAKGSNLDHVVSLQSLERQLITPGDPNAVPPTEDIKESDGALLQRFWLAPHAPAAGSRAQYRFQLLTLDQRPLIDIEKPEPDKVVMTFSYGESSLAVQVKDGRARRTAPGVVTAAVLAASGNGVAAQSLQDSVSAYFERDDVRPETDQVLIKSASITSYTMDIAIWLHEGPDTAVIKTELETQLAKYAAVQHRLQGKVLRSYIDHLTHRAGVQKLTITQPANDIEASWDEAPYCTDITVTVNKL